MIGKLLIANRGEVARRIIKTCKRLHIKTVAIYSEIDKHSLAVEEADEAYCVGPSPSSQSYLNIAAIIKVCQQAGVDAVHPGFGFLAENAEFAEAVIAAGFKFVGPSPEIIRLMGDKLTAKAAAARCGLPLVPGISQAIDNVKTAAEFAKIHGYPIILKAAAGGGGKGMRIVGAEADLAESLSRCQSESRSSFNDDRVFVEKYIINPRHIEVQVLGDAFGSIVHLGERDCSIQRRHQKIIEESPSPSISPQLRQQVTEAAVKLAKAVGYQSAGTVEFVVTPDEQFYFLEMNTRLQVEHPVTEECFGVDLVELMLRIAANEPLPMTQEELTSSGHAIEVRIYAEDADGDFLPSAGKLVQFVPPEDPGYRLDTGVVEGDTVSIFYDPMLAKLICHAPTRETALNTLNSYLSHFIIEGPEHNLNFLSRVVNHPDFIKGAINTHFIEHHSQDIDQLKGSIDLLPAPHQDMVKAIACAIGFELHPALLDSDLVIVDISTSNHYLAHCVSMQTFRLKNKDYKVEIFWHHQHQTFTATVNTATVRGIFKRQKVGFDLYINGRCLSLDVVSAQAWPLLQRLPKRQRQTLIAVLKSPMPGVLIGLPIKAGDAVKCGQPLAIIEAMKMENTLTAPADATIKEILVTVGDSLQRNQSMILFE